MTFNLLTGKEGDSGESTTMHGGGTNAASEKRTLEREALRNVIAQWNANRVDLFELSEPNEDLEFHGVMRFYFQDSVTGRAATKCVRVASDATAQDVVAILVEKFRPDMRMLTPAAGQYALYELHEQGTNGENVRKLDADEKPLLVQLNWHVDDRDGRFLLRNVDYEANISTSVSESNSSFRRKLSKREKKQLKKQEKLSRMKSEGGVGEDGQTKNVAEKLYNELPDTSFTRSISNPEAVMRRRRQQKLEKKLQQFRSKDGGPDTGGTLKIYGEALCQDVPYKTLLLSIRDCAAKVVKEMLNKYGLEGTEDPSLWCLVQTVQPPNGSVDSQEYVLDDDECPLAILMNHSNSSGSIMFHVRRRPTDLAPRKRKKKPGTGTVGPQTNQSNQSGGSGNLYHRGGPNAAQANDHYHGHHRRASDVEQCPMLLELGADQASESFRSIRLTNDVLEVGSANGIALQLYGPHIQPRHCQIQYNADSGITTITPCHVDALTYVNGQRIHQTTILQHGNIVKFGRVNSYRFLDPAQESRSQIYSTHDNLSMYDRSPSHKDITTLASDAALKDAQINVNGGYRERAMSPLSSPSIGSMALNTSGNTNFRINGGPGYNKAQAHSSTMIKSPLVLSPSYMTNSKSNPQLTNINSNDANIANDGHLPNSCSVAANILSPEYSAAGVISPTHHHNAQPYKDNYETTFDLDGNVETVSTSSFKNDDAKSIASDSRYGRGQDPILPAVLEFPETQQDQTLARIISALDPTTLPSFKLAPAYTLYLCARYRASTHYRPDLKPTERAHKLTILLQHISTLIQSVIQERYNDSTSQAFWLANSSELLHFLKSDRHICAFSIGAQETLAESVQLAFSHLIGCATNDLMPSINSLLTENNDLNSVNPTLTNLSSTMSLLRHCRVNAALTIQLFSQLFHYISARCLNIIFSTGSLCCKKWGVRLNNRLVHIARWAESQGLEFAAECYLAKIQQCALLLQASKQTAEEIANLPSTCFKLNSVQLGTLLGQYQCEDGEAPLDPSLVAQAVSVAQSLADELILADGREVRLGEQPNLSIALLLPEDGYSCDVVRGVPPGLADFLRMLKPPCRLAHQPTSAGSWTVYMHQISLRSPSAMSNRSTSQAQVPQPDIQVIKLHKTNSGMGLSIVAAKGAGQERLGIYIKSVVPGGAADSDGRLQAGDQLLRVDGQSLIGITQEKAAEYLVRTGPVVTLEVAKQGAIYHGLATLLNQPSPPSSRGPRRMSERDIPSRFNDAYIPPERGTIAASKSVPTLHQIPAEANGKVPVVPGSTTVPAQKNYDMSFQNPYSRTSSSNSINHTAPKSKSVHNLVSPTSPNPDQGFYQNLSVYRNKHDSVNGHYPLGERSSQLRSSQSSLQSNMQQQHQQMNPNLASMPQNQMQRPASAYYNNSPIVSPTSPRLHNSQMQLHPQQSVTMSLPSNRSPSMDASNHLKQAQSHQTLPTNAYYQQNAVAYHAHMKPSQSHSVLNQPEHHYGQMKQHSSLSALARGQAKIVEMSEEVKRRQARTTTASIAYNPNDGRQIPGPQHAAPLSPRTEYQSPNAAYPATNVFAQHYNDRQYYHEQAEAQQYASGYQAKQPLLPPVAPKPSNVNPLNKQFYGEEPPPVPPTSTHPLYTATYSEPPKGHYVPQREIQKGHALLTANNPWDREEREREQEARRDAARQWRDRQIADLSALTNRTPKQDEQLRALKLERDFQRRAEEAATTPDDDENSVTICYSPQPVSSTMVSSVTPVSMVSTKSQYAIGGDELASMGSSSSVAPMSPNSSSNVPPSILKTSSGPNSPSKKDNDNGNMLSSSMLSLSLTTNHNAQMQNIQTPPPPPPPERGSSYLAMQSMRASSTNNPPPNKNDNSVSTNVSNNPINPKRVSFNDSGNDVNINGSGNNGNLEVIREDPNQFITQAENMLASPSTPNDSMVTGSTPGVIGAQEFYRDPRTRRLAEQQAKQANDKDSVPEKLSFKEKMKMFAMETGEQGTPKDRSKISRAQREIDNIGSPSNNNNNNNTNGHNLSVSS